MTTDFSQDSYYQKLIHSIKTVFPALNKARGNLQPREELKQLWEVGKDIEKLREKIPHGRRQAFDDRLMQDGNLNKTDIFNIVRFYKFFPKGIGPEKYWGALSWSHVRETLSLEDPKIRQFYLKLAAQEGFSTRYLNLAIKHDLYQKEKASGEKHPYGIISLDRSPVYVYQAKLLEVTDGDTVALMADQGFYSHHQLTGRLRGINCSELKGPQTQKAEESKNHVREVLGSLEFFMIKTYKTDSFGRYVIDVLYHPLWKEAGKIFNQGYFLNQQLLDLGLARLAPF